MRIDKFLSNMGFGSRKEVKVLLKTKAVEVNGEIVRDPKVHVDEHADQVLVGGEAVAYTEFIYLLMNKPQDVISATEDKYDQTVIDLLDEEEQHFEPFPVGRLDKDTEGFLLLTNDGKLAHELLSPKKHVDKTYYALIEGLVTEADKEAFKKGVALDDGYVTKPASLNILESGPLSKIELTITEGKFHQVKRMFESVGKRVVYLKRLSMGPLTLDPELGLGEYRHLTEEEVNSLKQRK
ncbi:pseudouridine synthase [Microbacterium sp. APC 3898]|uniref:Pseudouridine synthase n=1 Tax=Planococcus notacanthi TaxID=3035188 RepID=A0ABT7ZIV1_9BACL|nr:MULTISPECIES: pseudouridine synthase [Terrabacteria group]MBF6632985.1 rRNA pseudouridine synthase [Planococcus sp. (in: firmicutes)]MDN3427084.1 pseudouridine synthase [Planococcus sp. APC 4016]MDN3439639.1 pseudouridine synthase [Planococcus sp. APC 3900]MDN3499766.1 pseudouridine synthase [Microbacterium sp. APC 3898]